MVPTIIIAAATVFCSRDLPIGKSTTSLAVTRPSQRSGVINPLDQVASAGIARSGVAQVAAVRATAVSNQADGETTQLALSPTTSNVVAKPAIPKTPLLPLSRHYYLHGCRGDSVTSVATKYGVTSDGIRWSNNISGDVLTLARKFWCRPATGINLHP